MKIDVKYPDGTSTTYFNIRRLDHDKERNEYTVYDWLYKARTMPEGTKIIFIEEE